MRPEIVIGIDPGVNTGIAVWATGTKAFMSIKTTSIHRAFDAVRSYAKEFSVLVRVEDASKRKSFGNTGRERLQGAGSIKRDCSAWVDFLEDHKIPYEMVAPKNVKTKLSPEMFVKLTGYTGRTSVHARDAAMLVFKY